MQVFESKNFGVCNAFLHTKLADQLETWHSKTLFSTVGLNASIVMGCTSTINYKGYSVGQKVCFFRRNPGISMSSLANRFLQNGSWGFLRRVACFG